MKKNKFSFSFYVLSMLLILSVYSNPIETGAQNSGNSQGSAGGEQYIHLSAPNHKIESVRDGFHTVVIPGYYSYGEPGFPDLPSKIYRIALPPNIDPKSITVDFSPSQTIDLGKFKIKELPSMSTWDEGEQTFAGKADIYSQDSFFPKDPLEFSGYARMRKWRIALLKFTPFQYNPQSQDLRYIPAGTVAIRYSVLPQASLPQNEMTDNIMDRRAEKIVFNFSESSAWYSSSGLTPKPSATYNYVIITTNAIEASSANLSGFVSSLSARGYSPLVITEDEYGSLTGQSPNGTAEKIRQWLINNYLGYGIEYVLLIGNPDPSGDIPMKMCWPRWSETTYRESPTDYFYADLTGNWDLDGDGNFGEWPDDDGTGGVDFHNELYVGRIPVYSGVTNLDSVLAKSTVYANAVSTLWRKSALLPMSFSDSSTDGAYLSEAMKTNYLTSAGFPSWTQYMQGSVCVEADSSFASNQELVSGSTKSRWTNNPYGMVWWWGHGSATGASLGYSGCGWGTIMSSSDSVALNDNFPSFVYQCSCNNGYPENSSNLGTALLYNGAIGTVSASRVSWYAVTSWSTGLYYYCDNASIGYYYGKELAENDSMASTALYDVKSDMGANHFTYWGGCHWMNLFDFNLYGDPTMALSPQTMNHIVYTPDTPLGPPTGIINTTYTYTTGGAYCSQGHPIQYRFDWGDGSFSTWSSGTSAQHSWTTEDTYTVRVQARCLINNAIVSAWSSDKTVEISQSPPITATIAYLKKGNYSANDFNVFVRHAPTSIGETGAALSSDYVKPNGDTIAMARVDYNGDGVAEIAYLKQGTGSATDFNLFICEAPQTTGDACTVLASDYVRPNGQTVAIAGVDIDGDGTDEIAYLKKGTWSDTDYDIYICSAPTSIGNTGTVIASDYVRPNGGTKAITGIDIDGDGIDEIAYLKPGSGPSTDHDLYICNAPTSKGEVTTVIASDYVAPNGQTVAITSIDIDSDGLDEMAYLKKGGQSSTDHNLLINRAPTQKGQSGALVAADYASPDGETLAIIGLYFDL